MHGQGKHPGRCAPDLGTAAATVVLLHNCEHRTARCADSESRCGHCSVLFGIAWRMLGNAADAEDILQEAYLRCQRTVESDIRSPKAFLVTIVTRLCLNHLDLARVKKEQFFGTN